MLKNEIGKRKIGFVWMVVTIVWMAVIFSFSAREADESAKMSHSVGKIVGRVVVSGFESWSDEKQEQFAEKIDFPVRKCAHASEYAVLGILILGTAYSFSEDQRRMRIWLSWCVGTVYAATDELHQFFVPGRSCQLRDVCIDSAGVFAGVLLFSLIKYKIDKNREIKENCKN